MVAKTVQLIVEENGERTIVGYAVLDLYNADQLDISATVTDSAFARRLYDTPGAYSILHKPKVS